MIWTTKSQPKNGWTGKISALTKKANRINSLPQKNKIEQNPQELSTGYPQGSLSPKLSTGYPQVINRQWSLQRSPQRPHRSPRSEPNHSETQRHKDSEPYSDIVSSEAYSSEPYTLNRIERSYTLNRIERDARYSIVTESRSVRDQFELQTLYCIVEVGQERGIPTASLPSEPPLLMVK